MKKLLIALAVNIVIINAQAQTPNTPDAIAAKQWQDMTPAQKEAVRAQAKSMVAKMSPAERANLEAQAKSLSPEQRKLYEANFR